MAVPVVIATAVAEVAKVVAELVKVIEVVRIGMQKMPGLDEQTTAQMRRDR